MIKRWPAGLMYHHLPPERAQRGCTCHPSFMAAPAQRRRSTSAWCASMASACRRCLAPSGDTYAHALFRRATSMSPRGSTVQPCAAAPCQSLSSISCSVKVCGGLPRAPDGSAADEAVPAAEVGDTGVVVLVREECRDILSSCWWFVGLYESLVCTMYDVDFLAPLVEDAEEEDDRRV